jgi:hypothetical protein
VESTAMIDAATKAHATAIPVIQYLVIVFPPSIFRRAHRAAMCSLIA